MYRRTDDQLLRTKIVATIGPEGRDLYDLEENLQSKVTYRDLLNWLIAKFNSFPVDIIRLNMSFYPENKENCKKLFDRLMHTQTYRKIVQNVAILADLPGAKMRLGNIKDGKVQLIKGDSFDLDFTRELTGNQKKASVLVYAKPMNNLRNFSRIHNKLTDALKDSHGVDISIGDGSVTLNSKKESRGVLKCVVTKTGFIKTKKGVTFHRIDLGLPSFEESDKKALEFLLKLDNEEGILAYVAVSFVRTPDDVLRVREHIEDYFKKRGCSEEESRYRCPDIIAKIETEEGVKNIDAILDVADGAMVARGDLGLQLELQDVPKAQKDIISLCNKRGKTAITATEMLASMEDNPKPTRAEVNDVFNAVLDGTDAVMLSGETADGKYPTQAIYYMVTIAEKAEMYFEEMFARGGDLNEKRMEELRHGSENLLGATGKRITEQIETFILERRDWAIKYYEYKRNHHLLQNVTDRICHGCCELVEDKTFRAIIAPTRTGRTARMLSRFLPSVPVVALAPDEFNKRKLLMIRGVYSIDIGKACCNTDEAFEEASKKGKDERLFDINDYVVFVSGMPLFTTGVVNQLQIKRIPKNNC